MRGSIIPFLKDLGAMNLGRKNLFRVILMLNARCPLRCKTCGIWHRSPQQEPSLPELESFFGINSLSWINLTGGEIFLREDLQEIFQLIASTQDKLAYLSFPTSGFLMEETVQGVEAALETKLPRIIVTVSFDGGRSTHDQLRGNRESFRRAAKTYRQLRDLAKRSEGRLRVYPGITLSAELLDLTEDPVKDLLEGLGLNDPREVHVNLAHISEHYYGNHGCKPLPTAALTQVVDRLALARKYRFSPMDILERAYLKGAQIYLDTGSSPLACKACSASVFIDATWAVFPCTIFPFRVGNLRSLGFDLLKLWEEPLFLAAKKAIDAGECPGCWTPCEAYTALSGALLKPLFLKLSLF